MPSFDLDTQRGLVCLFGMAALTAEGIAYYVIGKTLPDIFTGGFITMVMGPLLSAWAEKYRETKQRLSDSAEPEDQAHGKPSNRERGS